MLEVFPSEMLRLYCAEYEGEIIAANLVLFCGETATYLHGASGDKHRNVMAPFLLQWQAILDAKEIGCTKYDFGGVQTSGVQHKAHSDLTGVSNFKLGFGPHTETIVFPGTFDMIVNSRAYALYRGLQKAKMMVRKFRR
jgi:lipid II:glycine glycyltransferase (peptidoglycan interpeptide bridge formation enzyme)